MDCAGSNSLIFMVFEAPLKIYHGATFILIGHIQRKKQKQIQKLEGRVSRSEKISFSRIPKPKLNQDAVTTC